MFTGIVENLGQIVNITSEGENKNFEIFSSIASELRVDQSLSHNGVCLTVTEVLGSTYKVTAVKETLEKSNLGRLTNESQVNLERCMPAKGRFDGHIVQGHVDLTGTCKSIEDQNGSWLFRFSYQPSSPDQIVVEKGSITVNGVSLTCFDVSDSGFSVAIIPYTYEHTNFRNLQPGDTVNLEFDIIGKYISKILRQQ
jgi:riboflavin synthase